MSATHLPGEEFAVTVHGRAEFVDVSPDGPGGLRPALLDVYTPRYGEELASFLDEIGSASTSASTRTASTPSASEPDRGPGAGQWVAPPST